MHVLLQVELLLKLSLLLWVFRGLSEMVQIEQVTPTHGACKTKLILSVTQVRNEAFSMSNANDVK